MTKDRRLYRPLYAALVTSALVVLLALVPSMRQLFMLGVIGVCCIASATWLLIELRRA